jgi:hypothetical protein
MTRRLPNLLYVGDIPVEASYQSSIQLHRLLRRYPRGQLCIVETRQPPSRIEWRLPGVAYHFLPLATSETMRGAAGAAYRLWLTATVAQRSPQALRVIDAFRPEAILTIASGHGWLVAAAAARQLDVPLHLIAHDDWPKRSGLDRAFIGWSRARFARAYRQARSRLCVSPFMVDAFERRYGVRGSLLYPVRSPDDVTAAASPATAEADRLTIAFCGGSGAHVMPGLITLGRALAGVDARVVVFGPFDEAKRQRLRSITPAFEFRGFVERGELMQGLRAASLLFAPMAFDRASRDNMSVSFPSKLADYTAASVPILVHGPDYSSASRWARHHDAAAVVTMDDPATLRDAVVALHADRPRRQRLADRAVAAGDSCFDFDHGHAVFERALQ